MSIRNLTHKVTTEKHANCPKMIIQRSNEVKKYSSNLLIFNWPGGTFFFGAF